MSNPPSAKTVPVKRSKAAIAACKRRAKAATIPAEVVLADQLESLRSLRRRLCGYFNSDNRCDCKYLAPLHGGKPFAPRQGEQTGCCEIREAIYKLEIVRQGFLLAHEARGPQPAKP